MAITAHAYGPFGLRLMKGEVDLDTATLTVTLHDSSYTPDIDHDYFDDVSGEVSGGGYFEQDLTGVALAYVTGANYTQLVADNTSWNPITVDYRYAVLRINTGTPATDVLVLYIDFGSDQSISAGEIILDWDAAGFLRILA